MFNFATNIVIPSCILYKSDMLGRTKQTLCKIIKVVGHGMHRTGDGCVKTSNYEPAHEIMALIVFRKLILQTCMPSHSVGLDV